MSKATQLFGRTARLSYANQTVLFAALLLTGQGAKLRACSDSRPTSGRSPLSFEVVYPLTEFIIVSAGPKPEIFPKTFTNQSFIFSSAVLVVGRMPTFNPDLQQLNSDSRRACLQSIPGRHDASQRRSQYEATP
jgi:hypothetical protein